MDVKVYNATDWQELNWLNSGGTRAKQILQCENDNEWFFKCSERKVATEKNAEKYYKYEFWSEIIAYQLGAFWGLNILRYDVGYRNEQIGCISPKMTESKKQQLVEVGRWMTSRNPNFIPELYENRKEYTFQLLEATLEYYFLIKYLPQFLQTIIFDSVIGNTDRHQENWAFIANSSLISFQMGEIFTNESSSERAHRVHALLDKINEAIDQGQPYDTLGGEIAELRLNAIKIIDMAPIYDSGSSLGRELEEIRVKLLLSDKVAFDKYIEKGASEIHWNNKKLSHFNLVDNLLKSKHKDSLLASAEFIKKPIDNFLMNFLEKMDVDLPEHLLEYRMPADRKQLIFNLVTSRTQKLQNLIYGRV